MHVTDNLTKGKSLSRNRSKVNVLLAFVIKQAIQHLHAFIDIILTASSAVFVRFTVETSG